MVVWPTAAHSARICRSVASFAVSETRPFWIVKWTSADAVVAPNAEASTANATALMHCIGLTQYRPFPGEVGRIPAVRVRRGEACGERGYLSLFSRFLPQPRRRRRRSSTDEEEAKECGRTPARRRDSPPAAPPPLPAVAVSERDNG